MRSCPLPWLAPLLVAIGCRGSAPPATPAPPPDEDAAAPTAVAADGVAQPWVRITPQGSSMCVGLPDGSFHHVVYAVGGGADGFTFRPPVQVPVTRDVTCSDYGVMALGDKGMLSTFEGQVLHPRGTYPDARRIHVGAAGVCLVSADGVVQCVDGRRPRFDVGALGPVAELLGDDCARYRDGTVGCGAAGSTPPVTVHWTGTRQATVASGVMCVVLDAGQVSCRGDNRFGQRGFFGAVDSQRPTLVPGLDGVDEVRASSAHVCARRGGEVWCWGQADQGQAGAAARDASTPWARCEVDVAATEAERRRVAEGQRICSGPRPPGDDPFCRGMHGAYASTVYRGNPGHDCDPSGATRVAPPTRIDGLTDAIALATRGTLTCALRANRTLACWGSGASRRHEVALPVVPLPVERTVAAAPRTASLMVNEWGVIVRGAAGSLTFHPWRDGPLGVGQPLTGAVDATLAPGVCTLAADGATACEAAFDQPARTGRAPAGFDRFAGRERDCFLSPDGALRCERDANDRAARLSAAGDLAEYHGACARYRGGEVRCFARRGGVLTSDLEDVVPDAISLAEPLWPLTLCVVRRGGAVWCVGGTFDLGKAPPPEPVAIAGLPPASAVAAAYQHACVLATDATVWCWGRAAEGQLGPGAPAGVEVTPTPVAVPGVAGVVAIAAGTGRSCALTADDRLHCWGSGSARVQSVASAAR